MNFSKEPLLFKTNNNNNYILNYKKNQILYLHPIVNELVVAYFKIKDLKKCRDIVFNNSIENFEYYYKKFLFLRNSGFLDNREITISPVTEKDIIKSISEVKHIVFEVTEKCNLKCKYCTFGHLYVNKQTKNKDKDLSVELAKKYINFILNQTIVAPIPLFSISFYGGEPLLSISFIKEILNYVKENWPNQMFRFGMTTNAVLLNKYMDFLVQNNFYILISLDGNEKHNSYRTFKNNKSSFGKVFENILLLKNKHLSYFKNNVEFNAVMHSRNNTKEVTSFFLKEFNKVPQLTQELTSNGLDSKKTKEYKKIINNYTSKAKETPYYLRRKFLHFYSDYNVLLTKDELSKKQYFLNNNNATCLPFQVKLFISATGEVRNCEKIGVSPYLDRLMDENVKFNYKAITKLFKAFQNKSNRKCSCCYDVDCMECTLTHFNKNGEFNCEKFVTKNNAVKQLTKQFSYIESNPDDLFKEPSVI